MHQLCLSRVKKIGTEENQPGHGGDVQKTTAEHPNTTTPKKLKPITEGSRMQGQAAWDTSHLRKTGVKRPGCRTRVGGVGY